LKVTGIERFVEPPPALQEVQRIGSAGR
jgi:hypothetical protein